MFNRDGIFSNKKEEPPRREVKPVNLTPGLASSAPVSTRPTATPEPVKTEAAALTAEPAKPAHQLEESRGSKLIVGPDIKLKGVEITDCDTLVVEGRVEASMDSRVVQIAETGVFLGTVGIDVAEIRGRFEGELTARKHLVIHASGKVSGKIRYGRITIEEGGEICGDVSRLGEGTHTSSNSADQSESADIMTAYDPFARKSKPLAKTGV